MRRSSLALIVGGLLVIIGVVAVALPRGDEKLNEDATNNASSQAADRRLLPTTIASSDHYAPAKSEAPRHAASDSTRSLDTRQLENPSSIEGFSTEPTSRDATTEESKVHATVSGIVTIDGVPTADASVKFTRGSARTDLFGYYAIKNERLGMSRVSVRIARILWRTTVDVREGANQINLDVKTGAIEFKVVDDGESHGRLTAGLEAIGDDMEARLWSATAFWLPRGLPIEVTTNATDKVDRIAEGPYRLTVWDASKTVVPVSSDRFQVVVGRTTSIPDLHLSKSYSVRVRAESASGAPIGARVQILETEGGPRLSQPIHVYIDHPAGVLAHDLARGRYFAKCTPDDPNKKSSAKFIEVTGSVTPPVFTFVEGRDETAK